MLFELCIYLFIMRFGTELYSKITADALYVHYPVYQSINPSGQGSVSDSKLEVY